MNAHHDQHSPVKLLAAKGTDMKDEICFTNLSTFDSWPDRENNVAYDGVCTYREISNTAMDSMKVNFWRSRIIMNGSSLPQGFWMAGPKLLAKKKGILEFGANGPSLFRSKFQQRSTRKNRCKRSQFDRCPARPVFNRVVKAKVAVLRFWSDSSGSMSQLHLAVSKGATFPGVCGVGGCCGLVFSVGGLEVSFGCDFVTSKLRDQVRSQLESTGNGRFWLEGSFWIFERFQIFRDTHPFLYSHKEKRG